jgi:flagellin
MPLNSVNTNTGAMVALQSLNSTTSELATTQARINTGRKINDAKDNAAIWAIAQGQRAEVSSYSAVKESLQRGQSAIDVALSAGEAISENLMKMKTLALSASDANLDTSSREALQEEYNSASASIKKFVQNASFNGINLLDGSTTQYKALANSKGTTTVDVNAENLTFQSVGGAGTAGKLTGTGAGTTFTQASSFFIALDGETAPGTKINVAKGDTLGAVAKKVNDTLGKNVASINNNGFLVFQSTNYGATSDVVLSVNATAAEQGDLTSTATIQSFLGQGGVDGVNGTGTLVATKSMKIEERATFNTTTDYTTLLKQLDDTIGQVSKAMGRLGSGSVTMSSSLAFVSKLSDTLEAGIGNLVDADLAKESARLQALQTKQQLGVQALSIANQSTGVLLSLFR